MRTWFEVWICLANQAACEFHYAPGGELAAKQEVLHVAGSNIAQG
jgi:hypothetical protein